MLGMAMGLQPAALHGYLDGDLSLMAVPAEEAVELSGGKAPSTREDPLHRRQTEHDQRWLF